MHYICDPCFRMAGRLEELSIGTILTNSRECAYCDRPHAANTMHPLRGDADLNIAVRIIKAFHRKVGDQAPKK